MISTAELASILVERYGVEPGELSADLLAGIILDDHTRSGTTRTLRESVDLAKVAFPMWFGAVSKSKASASSRPEPTNDEYNPWRTSTKNVTMQVKIMAENPEMASRLKAAAR